MAGQDDRIARMKLSHNATFCRFHAPEVVMAPTSAKLPMLMRISIQIREGKRKEGTFLSADSAIAQYFYWIADVSTVYFTAEIGHRSCFQRRGLGYLSWRPAARMLELHVVLHARVIEHQISIANGG